MTVYCRVMSRYHVCVWLLAGGHLGWFFSRSLQLMMQLQRCQACVGCGQLLF